MAQNKKRKKDTNNGHGYQPATPIPAKKPVKFFAIVILLAMVVVPVFMWLSQSFWGN